MTSIALEFSNVSKRYMLGEAHRGLRYAVPNALRYLIGRHSKDQVEELWALADVSFSIKQGEAVGIIGPNGAGKTTSLKLATSVTKPTVGDIVVNGRLSSLIELGAGFHPELTGRENIYLNGTILGLKRSEINKRFDRIVDFSELEDFLDTPVKRYSSGMYARLGFSVAAHVEPDILIIDEVLAVGDRIFVPKCYKRMADLKESGTTVILVTHSMDMMQRLCDRAILLHRGSVIADGLPPEVVSIYVDNPHYASNFGDETQSRESLVSEIETSKEDGPVQITDVRFVDGSGNSVSSCRSGDPLIIRMDYNARQMIDEPSFEFKIHAADGEKYADHNTSRDGVQVGEIVGEGRVEIYIKDVGLRPGLYEISLAISDSAALSKYADHRRIYRLRVLSGRPGSGLIRLPHRWELKTL